MRVWQENIQEAIKLHEAGGMSMCFIPSLFFLRGRVWSTHVMLEYINDASYFPANRQLMLFSILFADLERSTAMFGRLADTNAMAQILYGLALRCVINPSLNLFPSRNTPVVKKRTAVERIIPPHALKIASFFDPIPFSNPFGCFFFLFL